MLQFSSAAEKVYTPYVHNTNGRTAQLSCSLLGIKYKNFYASPNSLFRLQLQLQRAGWLELQLQRAGWLELQLQRAGWLELQLQRADYFKLQLQRADYFKL